MVNPVCRMAFVVGSAGSGTPSEGEVEGERERGKRVRHTCTYVHSSMCSVHGGHQKYTVIIVL